MKKVVLPLVFLFTIATIAIGQTEIVKDSIKPQDSLQVSNSSTPVIVISASELEEDEESQDISGILSSSSDIYVSTAGFTFGAARFRIRGYGSENTIIMVNGISANDMESGGAYYSSWGGLNDATRNKDFKDGLEANDFCFGGVGGATNIRTRASDNPTGVKATYSAANRSYRNRIMVTASTGLMDNGWAITASGSRRWAKESYAPGTFYDAWSYFVAIERKINEKHSVGMTAFGAPTRNGKQGVSIQEAYDLAGTNYYNSNWGYQGGEVRNSKINDNHRPLFLINHDWKINETASLATGLGFSFGKSGSTSLNWYNANDPRPDYYKKLPSYATYSTNYDSYDNWSKSSDNMQIDWDAMYAANYDEHDWDENGNYLGIKSKYIVEERRNDHSRVDLNSVLKKTLNDHLKLTGGLNITRYKGFHYKVINDLLGGEFWMDIDQFAERDNLGEGTEQSDLNNPDNTIGLGEKFGYDYDANVNSYGGFAQGVAVYGKVEGFLAGNLSYTEFWRTGNMKNGKYPMESYGDSEKKKFTNYGVKGGATYKISGRNYLVVNGGYLTRAPNFRNSYISPRTRDHVVKGLENEKIMAVDAGYVLRAPRIKARLTFFYAQFNDKVENISAYNDIYRTFVNIVSTNIDESHQGVELGIDANVTSTVSVQLVGSKAQYIYTSRPTITMTSDNTSLPTVENILSYQKNYYVGGSPQSAASVGAKYRAPKFWTAGFNVNYFADNYIDMNPVRRTSESAYGISDADPQWETMLAQEKLPNAYTIDLYGFKSWKIKGYYIGISVNVNNLLNTTDSKVGGFEQLRFNSHEPDKFPSKYFYMYGRTYFINLNIRM